MSREFTDSLLSVGPEDVEDFATPVKGGAHRDEGPPAPLKKKLFVCAVCVAGSVVGGFSNGITIGAIGQVQGSINWTQRHPPTWSLLGVSRDALMIGMMQIGAILGAIIAGTIADKFGRKISCAISGLCQAFGGLICLVDFFIPAASRGTGNTMLGYTLPFIMYFIGRFVAGVGVGMACHSVPMIVAELSPEHLRGPFDGAFQLFVCLGITTSFVLNLIILTLGEDVTNWWGSTGFLMPLGMPAISGMLMALTVYFFCPESPKWLLTNTTEGGGGSAAARSALGKCRWGSDESTDAEYHRMVQAKRREEIESEGEEVGWLDLFSVGYFKIVAIAFGICWLQVFIGIDIMTTYNVPVFVNLGFTPKTANITTVVVGVVMLIAVIPSLFLVEVLGRKTLLIWGSIGHIVAIGGAGACALGVQLSCKGYPGDPSDVATYGIMDHWCEGNTTLPVLKWVGLVCCMGWVIAFALSWGPVAWVVPSEMLPAAVRSKALTLCVLGNWVSDYIVVASFPALMSGAKPYGAMFVYVGVVVVALLFVIFLVPETRGIEMESMEETHAQSPNMTEYRRRKSVRRNSSITQSPKRDFSDSNM